MESFKLIIDYIFSLLSIKLSIFGYSFSIIEIVLGSLILYISIFFVIKIFGGD